MDAWEKSRKIWSAFGEYLNKGWIALVEEYSLEELRLTKYHFNSDRGSKIYAALAGRIEELEKEKANRRNTRERRVDRIVSFISGLVSGILLMLFRGCF